MSLTNGAVKRQNDSIMECKITQDKFLSVLNKNSLILDIGGGLQRTHASYFESQGHTVKIADFFSNADYVGDFNTIDIPEKFDAVWCSHCLEHQLNVNLFLKKIASVTKPGGVIAITVPPKKDMIVGGHVTLWNAGLVVYNMVLAGIDCSNAHIKSYDYNVSVIAYNKSFVMPSLVFDKGDLNTLAPYIPNFAKKPHGHFDGVIKEWNW